MVTGPRERLYVIAEYYQHFVHWCGRVKLHPRDPWLVFLGENGARRLRGTRQVQFYVLSWPRNAWPGLFEELVIAQAVGITDDEATAWVDELKLLRSGGPE